MLTANIEGLKQVIHALTKLLLSGFLRSDQEKLITVFEEAFFNVKQYHKKMIGYTLNYRELN